MQIKADVVILGGGIQGLWLLADLVDLGYEALVLERTHLGCGQTGHAHVFLHEGHMYALRPGETAADAAKRIELFRKARGLWMRDLEENGRLRGAKKLESRFYIGFGGHTEAARFGDACKEGQIDSRMLEDPPPLFPACDWAHETNGVCLEAQAVVDAFLKYKDLPSRIVAAREIGFRNQNSKGFCVTVPEVKPKMELEIVCDGLVLSAGAGNERLIHKMRSSIRVDLADARQQTVKTYMLVVKTPGKDLQPAYGFFPVVSNIFLAHRFAPDGSIIWLMADSQRNPVNVPGEWTAMDARSWFRTLRPHLARLMPWLWNNRKHYEWGIYEAAKAEPWRSNIKYRDGGAPPQQHRVVKDPSRNVWAVWPSFLTLAPLAAKEVAEAIVAAGIPKSQSEIHLADLLGNPTMPAPDRWQSTPLLDWNTFERCYA